MTNTPGPWDYDPDSKEVFSGHENHGCGWVALVVGNDSNGNALSEPERLANARLIAAAPELLEALRGMLHWGECQCDELSSGERPCDYCTAVRAIAKAEGK